MGTIGCWAVLLATVLLGWHVSACDAQGEEICERTRAALSGNDEDGCLAAARQWLETLPVSKREMVLAIMRQSHPRADSLRRAINEKKTQLANVQYGKGVAPETLARLGLELQELRRQLRSELLDAHVRMAREAYVILPPLPRDAVCLPLPSATKG